MDTISVTPQVEYTGSPISAADGWTKISGSFIATGNYNYLTIGNFRSDSNTTYVDLDSNNIETAYYYIEDVSVIPVEPQGLPEGGDTSVCHGDSVRLTTLTDSISDYEWTPSTGLNSDTLSNPLASPDTTTTYTVTKRTCCDTTTAQVTVNVLDTPMVGFPHERCIQVSDSLKLKPEPISSDKIPSWSPDPGLSDTTSLSPWAFPDSSRTYTLTVTDTSNGCSSSDSIRIEPYRSFPEDTTIYQGDSAHYFMKDLVGLSYSWEPSSLVSDTEGNSPYLFPQESTAFTLKKRSLCDTATGSFFIRVELGPGAKNLFIPNVFAPNAEGDAENRKFRVHGGPFKSYHLQVFSRWGELVFETKDPKEAWKGRFDGEPVKGGVYSYQFRGVLENGTEVERSGTVTLLR